MHFFQLLPNKLKYNVLARLGMLVFSSIITSNIYKGFFYTLSYGIVLSYCILSTYNPQSVIHQGSSSSCQPASFSAAEYTSVAHETQNAFLKLW